MADVERLIRQLKADTATYEDALRAAIERVDRQLHNAPEA